MTNLTHREQGRSGGFAALADLRVIAEVRGGLVLILGLVLGLLISSGCEEPRI